MDHSQITTKKRLALAIIDFLTTSLSDGSVGSDDSESIEIAASCIAEAFKVDPHDKNAIAEALGGQNLVAIYSVFEKIQSKKNAAPNSSSSPTSSPSSFSTTTSNSADSSHSSSESPNPEAEKLKAQGNAAMAAQELQKAVDLYTRAIELSPGNPIYLSNRAAAYSAASQNEKAAEDAQAAIEADPKYSKAYSRLGLARLALGDFQGSMEAYEMGIEAEGNGGSTAMKKGYETAKKRLEESRADSSVESVNRDQNPAGGDRSGSGNNSFPGLAGLAGMLGGGGMPELSQLMNNPMVRQIAQNMMDNPGLKNMINRPEIQQLAKNFGGLGGSDSANRDGDGRSGTPDLSSLMKDPMVAEMARKMMGGGGDGGSSGSTGPGGGVA